MHWIDYIRSGEAKCVTCGSTMQFDHMERDDLVYTACPVCNPDRCHPEQLPEKVEHQWAS